MCHREKQARIADEVVWAGIALSGTSRPNAPVGSMYARIIACKGEMFREQVRDLRSDAFDTALARRMSFGAAAQKR